MVKESEAALRFRRNHYIFGHKLYIYLVLVVEFRYVFVVVAILLAFGLLPCRGYLIYSQFCYSALVFNVRALPLSSLKPSHRPIRVLHKWMLSVPKSRLPLETAHYFVHVCVCEYVQVCITKAYAFTVDYTESHNFTDPDFDSSVLCVLRFICLFFMRNFAVFRTAAVCYLVAWKSFFFFFFLLLLRSSLHSDTANHRKRTEAQKNYHKTERNNKRNTDLFA